MVRKDSEKDADRPHYYSQFWLDVAAGRRVIGAPRPNEEDGDEDGELPVSTAQYRSNSEDDNDGYPSNIVHPVAEPIEAPDDFIEPETNELDLATDDPDDADFADTDDADIPDVNLDSTDVDSNEDDYYEEDEEEEEEEDEDGLNWGRGRKKAKPSRPTKAPIVKKPGKRDTRRNF